MWPNLAHLIVSTIQLQDRKSEGIWDKTDSVLSKLIVMTLGTGSLLALDGIATTILFETCLQPFVADPHIHPSARATVLEALMLVAPPALTTRLSAEKSVLHHFEIQNILADVWPDIIGLVNQITASPDLDANDKNHHLVDLLMDHSPSFTHLTHLTHLLTLWSL